MSRIVERPWTRLVARDELGGRTVSDDGLPAWVDGGRPAASLVDRICQACVRTLPITGAAVSVMTAGGHRGVVAATDDTARALEDVQFTVGEGPGCDAFASGRAELVAELDVLDGEHVALWQAFREVARQLGVRAVFSFPLHLGAASLGALTAYHLQPGRLDGPDLARTVRLTDAAAVAVLDMIVGVSDSVADLADDGYRAIDAEFYRSEIYQAAGMIMVQLGVGIQDATVRLRSHAFASSRPIADVARDIVRRKLRLSADNE